MEPRIKSGGMFFDSEPVLSALSEDERKVLSRFGYFTMRDARQSIRKRNRPSRPGEAPSKGRGILSRFLRFAYDLITRSVVVGAEPVPGRNQVQDELEHGGYVFNVWAGKKLRMEPRPYMGPAFDRQLRKPLPAPWGKG